MVILLPLIPVISTSCPLAPGKPLEHHEQFPSVPLVFTKLGLVWMMNRSCPVAILEELATVMLVEPWVAPAVIALDVPVLGLVSEPKWMA